MEAAEKNRPTRRLHLYVTVALATLLVWLALAYAVLPFFWQHYGHQPALAGRAMVTRTASGIAGDPLNVGFVGSWEDIVCTMAAAGWSSADSISLKTSIEIVGSVLLDRPYRDAPVSPNFYDGRREDLAFEKEEGSSARRRHHVRLWRVLENGAEQRPVWLGAVTFDRGVELSRYTLQVTHRIASDVDAERNALMAGLEKAGRVSATYEIAGVGPTLNGRNGGGDRYFTDGEILIARLLEGCVLQAPAIPQRFASPTHIIAKNALWRFICELWR